MEREGKIKAAMRLREEGYNCAQSVLMPYSQELKIESDLLAMLSAGLGGGAGVGELCGVANALAIAEGLIDGNPGADGKKRAVAGAGKLCSKFSEPYKGYIRCRDLKGRCGKTCHELVAEGIVLLGNRLQEEED